MVKKIWKIPISSFETAFLCERTYEKNKMTVLDIFKLEAEQKRYARNANVSKTIAIVTEAANDEQTTSMTICLSFRQTFQANRC